jgi:hypothetical protein
MPGLTNALLKVNRFHKPASKKIITSIKKLRQLDNVYNQIVNPVSLCEISWDDMGDMLPCKSTLCNLLKTTPCHVVCEFYDHFTTDKDFVECLVSVYLKFHKLEEMDVKQKSLLMVKVTCFSYKCFWIALACCGVPKTHDGFVCFLDYLNFMMSTICD